MEKYYFTSESVTEGHPDKVCDQISDKILDTALSQDKESKMAVECTIKDNLIFIYGESSTKAKIPYEKIAKEFNKLQEVCYNASETYSTCIYCPLLDNVTGVCKVNRPRDILKINENITDLVKSKMKENEQ